MPAPCVAVAKRGKNVSRWREKEQAMRTFKSLLAGKAILGAALLSAGAVPAAASNIGTFSYSGDVAVVPDVNTLTGYAWQMTSSQSSGVVTFTPTGPLTSQPFFQDLTDLGASYQETVGTLGSGSPRFEIFGSHSNGDNYARMEVYWGPAPPVAVSTTRATGPPRPTTSTRVPLLRIILSTAGKATLPPQATTIPTVWCFRRQAVILTPTSLRSR
jgi:hypothetical protein